jgi:hypothetical protein
MEQIMHNLPSEGLTATEVSNIWSAYIKNSMEFRFFEYFYEVTEEQRIKDIVNKMLTHTQKNLIELQGIFSKENLSVPIGFTEEDSRLGAQKVFSDTFILYFCHDLTMLSMNTYPSALSDSTRKDIRGFFQEVLHFAIEIQNEITVLMLSQGTYLKPPQIAIDDKIEFAESIKYLNGLFGGSRPLNTPEIANLARIIHRAQFSKMVFVTFSKLASTKEMKQHFSKGRDEIEQVLELLRKILEKENIPISSSSDYKIFDVPISPFSDKLMLYFVNTCLGMFCFTIISQALTSSLRTDIITKLTKLTNDMKKYYGLGLLISIKEHWLEQPPQGVNRKV